ncbi:MAG: Ldh family oxidoreductase, partial [Actinobacteria bacterium]|nr:Ldh family oxidoreductase [Actinomycetota bacterium]
MIVKTSKELYMIVKKIILTVGADERNANRLAEALVLSDLSGVDTHGVCKLSGYVNLIKSGLLIPTEWPETINETEISALIKGNWTFGQTTAKYAMEKAIEKAQKNNIFIVSGVQTMHTGRVGEYVEMASNKKMISMMWSGGLSEEVPVAVPYGGSKPILHANPFAMGFPAGKESPVIIDFATTACSATKIRFAKANKQKLPQDYIVDKYGNPTCNPDDYYNGGALLPFGGHKGYALMLANEFLGRIFSSADSYIENNRGGNIFRHAGFTMIVFRADLFQSFKGYANRIDELRKRVTSVPPAAGFKEVLIPGDLERRYREERIKNGIPISEYVWQSIIDLA